MKIIYKDSCINLEEIKILVPSLAFMLVSPMTHEKKRRKIKKLKKSLKGSVP